MDIKISDIISGKGRKKELNYEFEISPFEFEGDVIKSADSCKVSGIISCDENILILSVNVKTKLNMICSRCLDTFIYPIDIDIEERFTNDGKCKDDTVVVIGDVLNIDEIVERDIISTLPIKRLCKTSCKGLCQVCGCNLNHTACNCQNDDVDIRFEALKGFFDKEV